MRRGYQDEGEDRDEQMNRKKAREDREQEARDRENAIDTKPYEEDARRLKSKIKRAALKVGAVFLGLVAANSSIYTVDQTEHAVITSFGNPRRAIVNRDENIKLDVEGLRAKYSQEGITISEGAGLKLKWPWQTANKIDRRIQRWDGYPEELPTKDKKNIWIETTARYYVEDPVLYFRKIQTEDTARAKLSDMIDSFQTDAVGSHDLIELVRTDNRQMEVTEQELSQSVQVGKIEKGREKILGDISRKSEEACHEYGIRVHEVGVLFKGLRYVESVKKEVEGRMISERTRIAEKYKSEGDGEYQKIMGKKTREVKTVMSEGYRKARDIEGQADAEVTRIYSEGFTNEEKDLKTGEVRRQQVLGLNRDPEFYQFLKTMELYQTGLAGKDKVSIVVGSDNPLMQYVKGPEKNIKYNVEAARATSQPTTRPSK